MYKNRDGEITLEGLDVQYVKFIEDWIASHRDPASPLVLLNVNDRAAGLPAVVGITKNIGRLAEAIFDAVVADANGHRDRHIGYMLCLASAAAPSDPLEHKPRLCITVDRDGKGCFCPPVNAEVKGVVGLESGSPPPV